MARSSLEGCLDDFVDNPAVRELAEPRRFERARAYDPRTGRVYDIGGRARQTPDGYLVELDARKITEAYEQGAHYNYHNHPTDVKRIERRLKEGFRPLLYSLPRRERKAMMQRIVAVAEELDRFGRHTPSPQDIEAMVTQEAIHWSQRGEQQGESAPRYGIVTNDPEATMIIEYAPHERLRQAIAALAQQGDEQGIRHLGRRVAKEYAMMLIAYVEAAKEQGQVPIPEVFRSYVNEYQPLKVERHQARIPRRGERRTLEALARATSFL